MRYCWTTSPCPSYDRLSGSTGTGKNLKPQGNIDLNNIRETAKTGVHYISIGAITKNIQAVDFSVLI